MAHPPLTERPRTPEDSVYSTTEAADLLGKTRQGIDRAVRRGGIPGFRDPEKPRIWVDRAWVDAHTPHDASVVARVEALEDEVHHLRATIEAPAATESLSSTQLALREEVTTLRQVNLLLLAAADARQQADDLLREALTLDDAAKAKRAEAMRVADQATALYRDALSQTQLPGSLGPDGGGRLPPY
jgi:hypothetical protein